MQPLPMKTRIKRMSLSFPSSWASQLQKARAIILICFIALAWAEIEKRGFLLSQAFFMESYGGQTSDSGSETWWEFLEHDVCSVLTSGSQLQASTPGPQAGASSSL